MRWAWGYGTALASAGFLLGLAVATAPGDALGRGRPSEATIWSGRGVPVGFGPRGGLRPFGLSTGETAP